MIPLYEQTLNNSAGFLVANVKASPRTIVVRAMHLLGNCETCSQQHAFERWSPTW